MSGSVWEVLEIFENCFVILATATSDYYIAGPFPPQYKSFPTLGQALAAIGHALDKEWEKINALRGVQNPSLFVRVAHVARKGGEEAFVLEIRQTDSAGLQRTTYHLLWRGRLGPSLSKYDAVGAALEVVDQVSEKRAVEVPASEPHTSAVPSSSDGP